MRTNPQMRAPKRTPRALSRTGLERAIQTMLKGEEALVQLNAAEGFGEEGHAELGVPPGACLSYAVTVDDVIFAPAIW